mmetsp:Transcript_41486/g.95362  ORF Transcript_41486/g.95362 Transcript_41486/m.95362 type:complete len:290 (-) Transcript_41486:75-944(-)
MGANVAKAIDIGVAVVHLLDGCDMGMIMNDYIEDDEPDYDMPFGMTRVLISANDYRSTKNPLTCTQDARSMQKLLQQCGISDVTVLLDNDNTKGRVVGAIQNVAARCAPGETFVFYYSGHGTQVEDLDGDEDDGKDEAFCFVDENGRVSHDTLMTDDEFRELLISSTDEDTNVFIISDCCHSGTIADFGTSDWIGRRAVSMSGCADSQTSKDVGGGVFTHCLLYAIELLAERGETDCSVAHLYNTVLDMRSMRYGHIPDQDIALQWAPHFRPQRMQSPFQPRGDFVHLG